MQTDRHRAARAAFLQLRDLPPGERTSFLLEICADDVLLREEVQSLLSYHDDAGDFLEVSAFAQQESVSSADKANDELAELPRRIGCLKVIRQIASGGMGAVYEAEQENPRRRVAVKLLSVNAPSMSATRRFRYEADILAHLQHPGIAQIYEAGTYQHRGRATPFFVMELISDGAAITRYADQQQFGISDRVRLIIEVCAAVQYGHQHGIIHRDLKPSNILVGRDGRVKVIDFGVARAIERDVIASTLNTRTGQLIGTPQYMSPEQFDADPNTVDIRADVYALGVVLFELLVGRLPFDFKSSAIFSMAETIRREQPHRLGRDDPKLRGDLETIVGKAIEKSPERRYQSVADLSRDLQNYLNNLPIQARRPSAAYQLRLLAKRHPTALVSAVFTLVALLAATGISLRFAWQTQRAEQHAAQRAEDAGKAQAAEAAARALADFRREEAEFQSYIANIVAADAELRAHGTPTARLRLARTSDQLRNWEYDYLRSQIDRSAKTLTDSAGPLSAIALSPDSHWFAAASNTHSGNAKMVQLWDLDRGKLVARGLKFQSHINDVAFSANGRLLAEAGDDLIRIYSLPSLDEPVFTARAERGWSQSIELNRKGTRLWSSTSDGVIRLWDVKSGELLISKQVSDGTSCRITLSPDETVIAVGTADGSTLLIDPNLTVVEELQVKTGHGITDLAFSHEGSQLAVCTNTGTVDVFDVAARALHWAIDGRESGINAVTWSPDDSQLVTAGIDRTLRVYDTNTQAQLVIAHGHDAAVSDVIFSDDGEAIITGSWDGTIKEWERSALTTPPSIVAHQKLIRGIDFSPDGTLMATAAFDGAVRIWDTASRQMVGQVVDQPRGFQDVCFAHDGKTFATAGRSSTVGLWNAETFENIYNMSAHEHAVHAVAFNPSGSLLASGGIDERVLIWDTESGELKAELEGHEGWIWKLAFAVDGERLYSCAQDRSLIEWDIRASVPNQRLMFDHPIQALALSPFGELAAIGLASGEIQIIGLDAFETVRSIKAHATDVLDLAFMPDGTRLVSSSHDNAVALSDVESGQIVLKLRSPETNMWAIAVSSDGRTIAAGSGAYGERPGKLRLWQTPKRSD